MNEKFNDYTENSYFSGISESKHEKDLISHTNSTVNTVTEEKEHPNKSKLSLCVVLSYIPVLSFTWSYFKMLMW